MVNGKIVNTMAMGGSSTGDQRNFGLVTTPPLPSSGFDSTQSDGMSGRIASSLPGVPRDQANLEAEKGETVLTDMNNDGNFELYSIGGNRHHSGGTPLNLPPQSFIYSDTSKMKLDKYELSEMGITSKKKLTPAKVSRGYELNKFIGILDDEHSDNITIDTAEYMLNKNKKSLSQLAFLQEAKKQFEDGVPLASYAYLTEKGMDPLQFSQQVEQISAQEAEQKMMMQLPYEQRLEMMMAKEQAQQQQAAMQQQQMMAQQQQQMGAPQGGQQGGPMHQMPDGSMMPGQSHGQEPQGMPPQGMMPPQPPLQQPMAMGKRGGQMSNLYKAQFGMDFMNPPAAVQDNTYVHPSNYNFPLINAVDDYDQVGMLEDKYLSEDTRLLHLQPETIMANYVKDTEANLRTFQNQQQFNLNSYGQSYQSGQNPAGFSDGRNQFDPEMVDFWEDHIKNGGTPPSNPSIEYTEAYKRVYPGQVPEEVGNVDADPSEGNDPYSTSYFAPPNNNEEINNQGQNITFAKGINTNPINTGDNSGGYDASGSPLNYSNTDNPYYVGADWSKKYGGGLPKAQYGLKDTGELAEEEFTINAGNTTRPDISTSVRNFNSEEDMFYHNATGFDNVNVQKYTGMNFGLNPIAAATGVPFGFSSGTDMPVVDRSNNLANFDLSTGINVGSTEEGDRTRAYAEGRGGLGWGMGNNWSRTFPNSASNTSMKSNAVHYLNPYLSGNAGLDFGLGNNESIGLEGTLNTGLSPYGKGVGANVNFKKGNFGVNAGVDDILNNPQTTFGASYSFKNGGDLPIAKKGKEINYNGETYNKRELKRLKNSKDPAQVLLYKEIMNGGPIKAKPTIDDVPERQNTEATSSETTRIGGSEDWATNYLSDEPGAQEYRDARYEAYVARRGTLSKKKQKEEPILGPQEYHNAYAQFQEQNAWLEKNLTQEERNTEIWDNGTNDQYIKSLEGSGMSPLQPEFISHVQSGYIGGEALKMMNPDEDITTYIQSGLDDQTVFGKAISPEDGKYGNTTNDQRESTTVIEKTPGEDCTNAAEMSTACDEAGGTWTPWDPETKTGCECSEKIIPPPPIKPPETPDAEFWLQDKMGIANAMDNKMSLKKYYPWAPEYNLMQIDPVFKDPTREIAAIGEQAVIAADTASSFAGPQRAAAVQAKAQGVAGKQIADAINKVQSDNVNIANTTNVKNAELEYKTQVLNNDSSKTLYDNTMLTEQNYDNALRESNAAITKQLQNAYTNRANTSNLNSIYPNFNIDPTTGGMIDITNPKAFYAQDNYVDPVSARDQYAKDYNYLIDKGVDPKKIPVYTPPNNKNRKTNAQNNEQVITGGYQQDGTSTGKFGRETRNNRLLKKGRALRNWFSPLRGN